MKLRNKIICLSLCATGLVSALVHGRNGSDSQVRYQSPCAVVADARGHQVYAALGTSGAVAVIDAEARKVVRRIELGASPTGLALSPDGSKLYVTCGSEPTRVVGTGDLVPSQRIKAGHGSMAPVISSDGRWLFVCNRFDNDVSIIDARSGRTVTRIPVTREPVAAALTTDGRMLVVANHLPGGRADVDYVAAAVDLIDVTKRAVTAHILLPNGSTGVRGVCVSPDGRYAFVTHTLGRYQVPTTQVQRGWINTNALTIIDMARTKPPTTVLLDDLDQGAANPWAVACTPDGRRLLVTHAGTNELSVIDLPALLARIKSAPDSLTRVKNDDYDITTKDEIPDTLSFLAETRRRVSLPCVGPRSIAVMGDKALIGGYFSDSMDVVPLDGERITSLPLGSATRMTVARRGEMLFNDGRICFQTWQSCASCHPDSRTDGLNWDLLNDGIGNPKNTKSMLYAHRTPPAMITGIRRNAQVAVRAGMKFILFAESPENDAQAIDAYLMSMDAEPSPHLVNGGLSPAAVRGRRLFEQAGCGGCHSGPLHTDQHEHDVGTGIGREAGTSFDTPSLSEAWRTAPYLYDGRAASMKEVISTFNKANQHGNTSGFTKRELSDLAEYVLSL